MIDAVFRKAMRLRMGLYTFLATISLLFAVLTYFAVGFAQARIWLLVVIAVLVILSVIVSVLVVVYRKSIWPDDPVREAEKALKRDMKRLVRSLFAAAPRIDSKLSRVPVNLFLPVSASDDTSCLTETGYTAFGEPLVRDGVRLSLWGSSTALAIRFELAGGEEAPSDVITALGTALVRHRPAMPMNAIFLDMDLSELPALDGVNRDRIGVINLVLNRLTEKLAVSPPLHLMLRGLEQNEDLVRAAILTESIGEERVFGGFLRHDGEERGNPVHALFTQMIQRIETLRLDALEKQLAPDFCASLINAPSQLQAIGMQTEAVIKPLIRPLPPRKDPFALHSIAFAGTSSGDKPADFLTRFYAQRYFQDGEMPVALPAPEGSISARHGGALAAAYRTEAFAIEPNRSQLWRQDLKGNLVTVALTAIVALFGTAMVINMRNYRAVNTQVEEAFEDYFQAMATSAQGADGLNTQINALYKIRSSFDGYDALPKRPIPVWLPKGSLESFYQRAYEKELTGPFQLALADYLEKDLFAYNALADGVTLFSLALNEAEFYTNQASNAEGLTTYFSRALAEEGQVSAKDTTSREALLGDLFALNQPPPARNAELNTVVAKTLTGQNTADLLYKLLLREPEFADRVDLRASLGPRFSEVFEPPEDPATYFVQRAFTREGFDAMYRNGEIAALRDMISNYDLLVGQMEETEIDNLLRRVGDLYMADYIGRWSDFLGALKLHDARDWEEAQVLMKALVNTSENPVKKLVTALQNEVAITFPPPLPPAKDGEKVDPMVLARFEQLQNSPQAVAARNISAAFQEYLFTQDISGKQLTQFDILLAYAREVAAWLDAAVAAGTGTGKFLFDQLVKSESATPLAVLDNFAQRSELPIVRSFGVALSGTLDRAAMNFVQSYVDGQWQQRVYDPYDSLLSTMFPFDEQGSSEITLAEFTEIFGPEGAIQAFKTQFLSAFEAQPGTFQMRTTFLPQNSIGLSFETEKMLLQAREITESAFVDGKPYAKFRLRVSYMDPALSEMNLRSGATLHRFAHGPMAWSDQAWPLAGMTDSDLDLSVYMRSRPVLEKRFMGTWSWFRLAEAGAGSIDPSTGVAETTLDINGNLMALQFDVATRSTPFAPRFFSRFRLPVRLFETYAIEPTQ
ncbi:ImcF-related family protein [Donghicola sp. XS_ASV15]|uniref:ImcF-related family protein n=1 Tax=Donghicola sp. XS_ASV15 TaxID=3241295 RepID=UPI0035195224